MPRKGGWDCHGLPVELEVEKELGLHSKHEIEAFGIAEFNQRCRESVARYVEDWAALTERSGVVDRHRRRLLDDGQRLHRVGLVAAPADVGQGPALRGPPGHALLRPVRHGAVLARAGPAQGYRDVVDPSVYVRFPRHRRARTVDADLLVWTTTPWTLLSNVAAAVGPDIDYVRIAAPDGGRDLVLAEAAAARRWPRARRASSAWHRRRARRLALPAARSTVLPLDERRRAGGRRPTSSPPTTARASSTSPRPSARTTPPSAGPRASPVLNPVEPDGAFDDRVPPLTRAGS